MNKMTAVLANRLYDNGKLAAEDIEVTLPAIEAQVFELKAMGTFNVVLPGLFNSMEMTIKTTGATRQYASISGFGTHKFTVTVAQNDVSPEGTVTPKQFKAKVTAIGKKIGDLSIVPGEAAQPESSYEVVRYEAFEDGKTMWVVDKLKSICQVYDASTDKMIDYGSQIQNLLEA